MAKKKKKILKILIISIAALVAILFFISLWLNSYLRRTIEDSLNQMLDAKVKVDKVRFRVFSSTIDIYGIEILGKKEFNDETLLVVHEASVKLKDFDKSENKIILEHFILESPLIKNITLPSGLNSWEESIKKEAADTANSDMGDMKMFCENIMINNAELQNENRQTGETHTLKNTNIELTLWEDDKTVGGDYKLSSIFKLKSEKKSDINFSINASGDISFENSEFRTNSKLEINNNPFELNLVINYDTVINKASHLQIIADMQDWKFNNIVESKGIVNLEIQLDGAFNDSILPSLKFDLNVSDFTLVNKSSRDSLYCNFDLGFDYNVNEEMFIGLKSYNFQTYLLKDSIDGDFQIEFNDTACISQSSMDGIIDLKNLNKIFTESDLGYNGSLSINSDLNGTMDASSNKLIGEFKCEYKDSNSDNYYNLILNPKQLINKLSFESSIVSTRSSFLVPNIENIYKERDTKLIIETYIKKLDIPISNNIDFKVPRKMEKKKPKIIFPKHTSTSYNLKIDSLILGGIIYSNIDLELIYSPQKLGVDRLNAEIANGRIESYMYFTQNDENIGFKNNLSISNLDLAVFATDSIEILGIVNVESHNELFSLDDTIISSKNIGRNIISLEDFSIKNKILQDYAIDEDYINIDSLYLIINIEKNLISLSPTEFMVNEVELSGHAQMDIATENILLETFLNVPDKYVSSEIKLLISVFTKSVERSKIKPKEGENIYKLKITGNLSDLEYEIYEY